MSPIVLLGVYRSPPPLPFDLEIPPCTAPHRDAAGDARCRALPPHPPRFPAQIEASGKASSDTPYVDPAGIAWGGWSFVAPLRRGLILMGLLVCGALVGSSVTASAIIARRAPDAFTRSSTPEAYQHRRSPPPQAPAPEPPRLTPPLPEVRLPHAVAVDPDEQEPLVTPPFALASFGTPTHAPAELARRAAHLAAAGVDLVLTRTTIAARTADNLATDLSPTMRITRPASGRGVRITDLPHRSVLRAVGLETGDMVTAINGFGFATPDEARAAHASVVERRTALVELVRAGHLIVLEVTVRSPELSPVSR